MIAHLENRRCLFVTGEDAKSFLQGIITNDMNALNTEPAVYSCFLTPQGKFLYDFIVTKIDGGFCLEVLTDDAGAFAKRLKVYALRAKVSFEWRDDIKVYVLWGDQKADTSKAQIFYQDPRLNELGLRMISNEDITTNATMAEYDTHRVMLGVPDGSRDLKQELSTLYDGNLDQLNAISLKKGCFLGQELTARIHYRGLVKKRLMTVTSDTAMQAGFVQNQDGKMAGEILSVYDDGQKGLALVKLTHIDDSLHQEESPADISVLKPAYLKLPV